MRIDSQNNKINFGHKTLMHAIQVEECIVSFPKLAKHAIDFAHGVKQPDFDERGIENLHFYFKPTLFKPRESFLDFSGGDNAFSRYLVHANEFLTEECTSKYFVEHASRALHFLQDMSQPQHTQRGSFVKKYVDFAMHKEYETQALSNVVKYMKDYESDWIDYKGSDFEDLFVHTVDKSHEIEPASKSNRSEWDDIAQKSFNLMQDATKQFFTYLSDIIK